MKEKQPAPAKAHEHTKHEHATNAIHEHQITQKLEAHRKHTHTNLHRHKNHDRNIKLVSLYAAFFIPMLLITYMTTKGYKPAVLPGDKIHLVMPNHLKSGEPVIFSIVNDSDQTIFIENHCPDVPFNVYKWSGSAWIQQHAIDNEKICKEQDRNIPVLPHSKAPGSYSEWPDLFKEKGLYQINTEVEGYDQSLSHDLLIE